MQAGFELLQKQTMKLSLTPELQQSINILQYSTYELIDFLHRQANENPVLEISETFKEPPDPLNLSFVHIKLILSYGDLPLKVSTEKMITTRSIIIPSTQKHWKTTYWNK